MNDFFLSTLRASPGHPWDGAIDLSTRDSKELEETDLSPVPVMMFKLNLSN
jgi:hypothetical protein